MPMTYPIVPELFTGFLIRHGESRGVCLLDVCANVCAQFAARETVRGSRGDIPLVPNFCLNGVEI